MRIENLKIRNIRCWYDEHEYDFCKYTAFIGENSSGKSTLQDIIYYGLQNQEIAENMVSRNTFKDSLISFKISFTENEISNTVQIISRDLPRDEDLSYLYNAKIDLWNHLILTRNKIYDNSIPRRKDVPLFIENQDNFKLERYEKYIERIVKEEISTNQVSIDYIKNTLRNCILSNIMKNIIKLPSTRKISSSENVSSRVDFSTSHDGKNIRGLLFNAKNSKNPKMRQKYMKFQETVQGWSFIPGKPEILAKTGENIDLFFVDENENQHRIEEVGDGIKEAVIIASISILQPDKILLIEEPELHLHPRALRELRELLKHEHDGQVIISTHNPVFINEIDDETSIFKIIKKTEASLDETRSFLDYLKINPMAKGGFGEGIVDILLSKLPKDYVKTQFHIPEINARIDFCVNLPDSDVLIPIDSKFILPSEMTEPEKIIFDDREIARLNKRVIERAKEIERYTEPAITTDFVLMYIPDFLYGLLDSNTYIELIDLNVIPTNTSGLLSTIFMINMQHRFIRLNSSAKQFGSFQVQVSQGIRRVIDNMGTGKKQINHCLNNINTAVSELEKLRENVEEINLDFEEDLD